MSDISSIGLKVRIVGSLTFPVGFEVTQFADDSDPFDLPDIQIADKAMGVNGDLVTWSTAVPIEVSIAVIPDSDDDRNLGILAELNRVGRGKLPVKDSITMIRSFPDERPLILTNGKIVSMPPASSSSSAGRKKSKVYKFVFENKVGI